MMPIKIDDVDKEVIFKSNVPFTSSIFKINSTFIDIADDLEIAIPIYKLLEYSEIYEIIKKTKCMMMLIFQTLNHLNKKQI